MEPTRQREVAFGGIPALAGRAAHLEAFGWPSWIMCYEGENGTRMKMLANQPVGRIKTRKGYF